MCSVLDVLRATCCVHVPRATCHVLRATCHVLRATCYVARITRHGSRTERPDHGLRTTDHGPRTTDYCPFAPIANRRFSPLTYITFPAIAGVAINGSPMRWRPRISNVRPARTMKM